MDLRMLELNEVRIAGRLTRDAEKRELGNTCVATFGIAATESYKDKSGERQETVTFVDCEYWNPADYIFNHLTKGFPVLIEGSMRLNEYEKDGEQRKHTRIRVRRVHLLGWAEDGQPKPEPKPDTKPEPKPEPNPEDIPF